MNNYKYLLLLFFLSTACLTSSPPPNEEAIGIEKYLIENVAIKGYNGKIFCSYVELGSNTKGDNEELYIWAILQEYYFDESIKKYEEGTAISLPVALLISSGKELVLSHITPGDGELFSKDVKSIFPSQVQDKILNREIDFNHLTEEILQKAEKWIEASSSL